MDPVTTITLIMGLITTIQKCREDREPTDEELLGAARGAPGIFAIRRNLKSQGLRGRRFRKANREAVNELKAMSDEDLMEQFIAPPEGEADEDGEFGFDYDLFA